MNIKDVKLGDYWPGSPYIFTRPRNNEIAALFMEAKENEEPVEQFFELAQRLDKEEIETNQSQTSLLEQGELPF